LRYVVPDAVAAVGGATGWVPFAGWGNDCSVVACADEAEYVVMALTSCAHISEYSASLAMIAAVFCPRMLVAQSVYSSARLYAISAGFTVAANASW
jgi:hypothetical protein